MSSQIEEKKLDRRRFLKVGGTAAVGGMAAAAALTSGCVPQMHASSKTVKVANLADVEPNVPIHFNYPEEEPAVLLDMGRKVKGGIGPNKSIVAFSTACQHMGCEVRYRKNEQKFLCPCHASMYDPADEGRHFEGPTTMNLPQISLSLTHDGKIEATGIVSGLVYGRACNEA